MVQIREIKIKNFLANGGSSLSNSEIENLFEYKPNESDAVVKDLNNLATKNSEKNTFNAFGSMSLGGSADDENVAIGRKRRTNDIPLVSGISNDFYSRSRENEADPYSFRSKRRREYSPSPIGTPYSMNF